MKTLLYLAVSINGYIASENDNTSFVSKESWNEFEKLSKKAGNLVVGKTTHDIDVKEKISYPNRLKVVMTRNMDHSTKNVLFTYDPPETVLKMLEEKGYSTAFIAGGSRLASNFLNKGLADEIYLDVHPITIKEGTQLFAHIDSDIKLELIDSKKLSKEVMQLHYTVKK